VLGPFRALDRELSCGCIASFCERHIECNDGHPVGGGATLSGAPGDWQLNSTFPI
jgi:hypothetical protein